MMLPRYPKGSGLIQLLFVLAIMGILGALAIQAWQHYLPLYRLQVSAHNISHLLMLTRFRAIARNEDWGMVFDESTNSYLVTRFSHMVPVASPDRLGPFPLGKGIRYAGRERTASRPGPTTFYKDRVIFCPLGYMRGISGSVYIADEFYREGTSSRTNLRHRCRVVVRCNGGFISVQATW